MIVASVLLLLLMPMQVWVIYLIWRHLILQTTGPLGRLREPKVRRDFVCLMLASGFYIAGAALLLAKYLPGV